LPVIVKTDPEWIPHLHAGDHAGRYEISQLMDIGDKSESAGKAHYRLPKRETKGTVAT
jgi:hypothetical protein